MVDDPGGSASNISFTLLYMVTRIGIVISAPKIGPIVSKVSIIESRIIVALVLTGP